MTSIDQTPKRFKRACRRHQWAKATYILRQWRRRRYERFVERLMSGGW